jgi:hypothetical protein
MITPDNYRLYADEAMYCAKHSLDGEEVLRFLELAWTWLRAARLSEEYDRLLGADAMRPTYPTQAQRAAPLGRRVAVSV